MFMRKVMHKLGQIKLILRIARIAKKAAHIDVFFILARIRSFYYTFLSHAFPQINILVWCVYKIAAGPLNMFIQFIYQ